MNEYYVAILEAYTRTDTVYAVRCADSAGSGFFWTGYHIPHSMWPVSVDRHGVFGLVWHEGETSTFFPLKPELVDPRLPAEYPKERVEKIYETIIDRNSVAKVVLS